MDLVKSIGRPIATTVLGLSRPGEIFGESELDQESGICSRCVWCRAWSPGILLIKMADRIHNMENTRALPLKNASSSFRSPAISIFLLP